MTVTFEMKSGREQSTPDKAMWGFACTVRPQDSAEDSPSGLPFFLDLYLSLASVCCSLILKQYSGPAVSEDEFNCKGLLSSELMQRWVEHTCICISLHYICNIFVYLCVPLHTPLCL